MSRGTIVFNSPIGKIKVIEQDSVLIKLCFEKDHTELISSDSSVLLEAKDQIINYLNGIRKDFDLPIKPDGTEFQKSVWEKVNAIKYGESSSYLDLAISLGDKKLSRAVGMANSKNPLPILIPCHRVISKSNKLNGYLGGVQRKEFLLQLEKNKLFSQATLF